MLMHSNLVGSLWEDRIGKTRQGKNKSDRWGRRETKTDKGERRVHERENQSEWMKERGNELRRWRGELDVLSLVRAEGDRFPSGLFPSVPLQSVIGFSRLQQVVCEGNFVHGSSQIRVNAAQRFLHYTGHFGSLSLPPHLPLLSAPIRHKGFLPAKLSGHFWHLQQTNCFLQPLASPVKS